MGQAKNRGSYEERVARAIARKNKLPENICIICREEKPDEMSDEHVIPDALGGYYHIYCVCKDCNSFLGSNVDIHLINHKFSEFYRMDKKLYGKSGKLPNPFSGYFTNEQSPDLKYKTFINKNQQLDFRQVPTKPQIQKDENGIIEKITIVSDEKDKNIAKEQLQRILQKNDIKEGQYTIVETIKTLDNSIPFQGSFKIDIQKFKIGLLKIAYEFAVDKIPAYFYDTTAIKISSILQNADLSRIDDIKMSFGIDFENEIFKPFEFLIDFKNKHTLILTDVGGGLKCFIKLDNIFAIIIELSTKSYLNKDMSNSLILINSLSKRDVTLTTFFNEVNNRQKLYTSFQFYSDNELEIEIIKNSKISYLGEEEGNPILFNRYGGVVYTDFKYFLDHYCCSNVDYVNNLMITIYEFDLHQEVYIKDINSCKLYRVVGFKMEAEFDRI